MPVVARTIGGPGAGKTHRMLTIIEMVMEKLVSDPLRIGFVSFTRAARREAADRAASKFGIPAKTLEKEGWFRTLHSVAYRQLGIQPGELVTGNDEDTKWLREVLGDDKARLSGNMDDDLFSLPSNLGESTRALSLWDAARNRQTTLQEVWQKCHATDDRTPDLDLCQSIITVYEAAKAEGGRLDFADLLMRFAGRRWTGNHSHPYEVCDEQGQDVVLPVWIGDEMQDSSQLTALVFKRLIRASTWVYLAGDVWQSIYSFSGCDGSIFGEWPVAKEEVLPTCYRCPQRILDFSDAVMLRGGHKLREFKSERQGGDIVHSDIDAALASVKADQDTLVLARTNEYARQAADYFDDVGIPWTPTKGGGGFAAPARAAGIAALVTLKNGGGIDGEAVHRLMELLPARIDGGELFVRGAKSHYADKEIREKAHSSIPLTLTDLVECGATRMLCELIASGRYVDLLEKPAQRMAKAAHRHGIDAVLKPRVRVGTCHSAKGMQADHVIAVNRVPYPTQLAMQDKEGMDEERRVWFVTASRAKEKLTVAETGGEPFPDL